MAIDGALLRLRFDGILGFRFAGFVGFENGGGGTDRTNGTQEKEESNPWDSGTFWWNATIYLIAFFIKSPIIGQISILITYLSV